MTELQESTVELQSLVGKERSHGNVEKQMGLGWIQRKSQQDLLVSAQG